jgi:AcrR family transcriptional regulator
VPARQVTEATPDTTRQNRRRATQLERLLDGMIAAAGRGGYANASVSAVIEEAGVSRPTFYEYFENREACFAATLTHVHEQLLAAVEDALTVAAPDTALQAAVSAVVAFAAAYPAQARFLMKDALAGGPGALDVRDRGIAEIAARIEDVYERGAPGAEIAAVPLAAVIGAVYRMLAARLRRGEQSFGDLGAQLGGWLASYRAPIGAHRWRALERHGAPERSPYLMPPALRSPEPLRAGRQRLPKEEIAENHRKRIMFATAQAVREHGYSAVTVAMIMKLAGLDGRAFYRLFADKSEAFTAIHELGFQYLMSAAAGAFFACEGWPERIWEGLRAATQSIDDTPAFAHVGFVEAYAVGPAAIQRVEDSRTAFTIFLREGHRCQDPAKPAPSDVALEAIVTSIFEIIYLDARASPEPQVALLLAHLVHLALTPFIGVGPANAFLRSRAPRSAKSARRKTTAPRSALGRKMSDTGARRKRR